MYINLAYYEGILKSFFTKTVADINPVLTFAGEAATALEATGMAAPQVEEAATVLKGITAVITPISQAIADAGTLTPAAGTTHMSGADAVALAVQVVQAGQAVKAALQPALLDVAVPTPAQTPAPAPATGIIQAAVEAGTALEAVMRAGAGFPAPDPTGH